jgi:hypothetical protein
MWMDAIEEHPKQMCPYMLRQGVLVRCPDMCCAVLWLCAGDYFDPMFVKPMVALRPLHYSAEVGKQLTALVTALWVGDAPSVLCSACCFLPLYCHHCVACACVFFACIRGSSPVQLKQKWQQMHCSCCPDTSPYACICNLLLIPSLLLLLPMQVSVPTEGVYGCGAHSDYGLLTILATDEVPGLQVILQPCPLVAPMLQ